MSSRKKPKSKNVAAKSQNPKMSSQIQNFKIVPSTSAMRPNINLLGKNKKSKFPAKININPSLLSPLGASTTSNTWRCSGHTFYFSSFRHPKHKFRHPKYSGISSDTQSISSDTHSISSDTQSTAI